MSGELPLSQIMMFPTVLRTGAMEEIKAKMGLSSMTVMGAEARATAHGQPGFGRRNVAKRIAKETLKMSLEERCIKVVGHSKKDTRAPRILVCVEADVVCCRNTGDVT